MRLALSIFILLNTFNAIVYSQVKVRIFSGLKPKSVVFSVTGGKYEISLSNGRLIPIPAGEQVVIMKYGSMLSLKSRNSEGFIADSVFFKGTTGDDAFILRVMDSVPVRQYYSGNLHCFADMETIVLVNDCKTEDYIAGVVRAEGGTGRNIEYFKSQAVIARTYLYKHYDKHLSDRYNVCDNTHCQVFNGLCSDTVINSATLETRGLVIAGKDSVLIISAFHSNCGGETSSSEDVWLSAQPFLKKVNDPYCHTSKNAFWEKRIGMTDWVAIMKKSGYTGVTDDPAVFRFVQKSRSTHYSAGSFTIPFSLLRSELSLRSSFFSVIPDKDSVILRGKGYGHGVGLCQEGAMVMASKGFNFLEIIDFYYAGVIILDIKNAVNLPLTLF
jgi:stage II sporulation protein D